MQKSTFKPWIGRGYSSKGLYGVKVLFLGESHYGTSGKEKPDTTINVVRRLGQENRHRFFTTTAKLALFKGSKNHISNKERKELWENVAFYNYIQEFVADGARKRPSPEMWKSSENAFLNVLQDLKPELLVILGKELNRNLPSIPTNIKVCRVNHPSSGFRYKQWIPKFKESLIEVGAIGI